MPDVFPKQKRSLIMSSVRSKDTGLEMKVRRALHKMGFRYRLHDRTLPGTPDLVFPRFKTVVQVRGCFWHQHSDDDCPFTKLPQTHAEFWKAKLEGNAARDTRNDEALRRTGWNVLVVWQCECRSQLFPATLEHIRKSLRECVC